MRLLHAALIRPALLLSFFISFAALNFEASNWGLQWSWLFALVFCLVYLPSALSNTAQWRFFRERRFRLVARLFVIIFGTTLLAWGSLALGITQLPADAEGALTRSIGHMGYLSFYSLVFVCIYHFLRRQEQHYWLWFRWMFLYPFFFIAAWGIYQNLSTYNLIEYNDIFNNSLSTGFTFERFKEAHRVSSVFPEPSEYSYYLAMMTPIVWAVFRRRLPGLAGGSMLVLLLTQIVMVRSLSYFVALPVVAFVIIRHVEGVRGLKTVLVLSGATLLLLAIAGFGLSDRLADIGSGDDGSTLERYVGLIEALDLYIRSPVFGFGYGIVRGLDAVSFLLASLGTLGSLAFVVTLGQFARAVSREASPILAGAFVAMIASCIASNNVLSHIFVWVLLAFFAACPRLSTTPARKPRRSFTMNLPVSA